MSQESSLQKTLTNSFWKGMEDVFTAIPGVVVSIRDGFQNLSIDVQPALNIKKEDGTITERPAILNVPVQMPCNREGGMTHNLSVGDPVFLLFSMEGIDLWKRGNGMPTTSSDFRKFDKKDCVAIPSPFPFSESVNRPDKHMWAHDPTDVVLFHNLGTPEETEVRLHRGGGVTINTNQHVNINANSVAVVAESAILDVSTLDVASPDTQWVGNINYSGTLTINGTPYAAHIHSNGTRSDGNTGGLAN